MVKHLQQPMVVIEIVQNVMVMSIVIVAAVVVAEMIVVVPAAVMMNHILLPILPHHVHVIPFMTSPLPIEIIPMAFAPPILALLIEENFHGKCIYVSKDTI